jgi:large subunit ribosomal protein L10
MASPEKKAARPDKVEAVEVLKKKFSDAAGIILADFTGLTVEEANNLRRKCREAHVEYRVIKNTLARLAARAADLDELEEHFQGPVAVAMSESDSIAPARVIAEFRRGVQKPAFKAGYLEGRMFTPEEIRRIAVLPSKEGLIAQVIGAVEGPMAQLVFTLEGVLRNLISILEQASQKAEGSS